MRSKILSKQILASCVWYSGRAYYGWCVLAEGIGRRLPLQVQCSYQCQQGGVSQSVRGNYKTRVWEGQNLTGTSCETFFIIYWKPSVSSPRFWVKEKTRYSETKRQTCYARVPHRHHRAFSGFSCRKWSLDFDPKFRLWSKKWNTLETVIRVWSIARATNSALRIISGRCQLSISLINV